MVRPFSMKSCRVTAPRVTFKPPDRPPERIRDRIWASGCSESFPPKAVMSPFLHELAHHLVGPSLLQVREALPGRFLERRFGGASLSHPVQRVDQEVERESPGEV